MEKEHCASNTGTPPNYYCNVAQEEERGRRRTADQLCWYQLCWMHMVLILCESLTQKLPMHNAKQSVSVPVAGLGKDGDPYEPHAPSTASSKRVSPGCCNHPPFPNPILRIHFPFSTFSLSLSQSSSCQSTARSRYRERRSCVCALIEGFPLIKA